VRSCECSISHDHASYAEYVRGYATRNTIMNAVAIDIAPRFLRVRHSTSARRHTVDNGGHKANVCTLSLPCRIFYLAYIQRPLSRRRHPHPARVAFLNVTCATRRRRSPSYAPQHVSVWRLLINSYEQPTEQRTYMVHSNIHIYTHTQ
jgi:hypothetical protein